MKRVCLSIPALLTLIFFMNSCVIVRQYKTSDVRKALDEGISQVNQSVQKVEADKKKRQVIYDELISLASNNSLAPYPALKKKLDAMNSSLNTIRSQSSQLAQVKGRFEQIAKGKSKIKSNQPEWERMQKIRDEFPSIGDTINDEIKRYQGTADDFNDLLKEYKIVRIKVSDIESKFRPQLNNLKDAIQNARSEMGRYRKGRKGKEKTLGEMESILGKIDSKNASLNKILDLFTKEVQGKTVIMAGPGMKSYSIVNDIREAAVEIQGLIEQFRVLGKVL